MSALPPKATSNATYGNVRFGPIADIPLFTRSPGRRDQAALVGTVRPSALAVVRLMASSNLWRGPLVARAWRPIAQFLFAHRLGRLTEMAYLCRRHCFGWLIKHNALDRVTNIAAVEYIGNIGEGYNYEPAVVS